MIIPNHKKRLTALREQIAYATENNFSDQYINKLKEELKTLESCNKSAFPIIVR